MNFKEHLFHFIFLAQRLPAHLIVTNIIITVNLLSVETLIDIF